MVDGWLVFVISNNNGQGELARVLDKQPDFPKLKKPEVFRRSLEFNSIIIFLLYSILFLAMLAKTSDFISKIVQKDAVLLQACCWDQSERRKILVKSLK